MWCAFAASVLQIPARIFPIYLPIGNMATGFFVVFSLIAGVVGMATSATGLNNIAQWDARNLHTAAASSLTTWALTLLAMGYILLCSFLGLSFFFSFFLILFSVSDIELYGADWHVKRLNLAGQIQPW